MATYLDKPAAVAALIRDDEVHRDVYTHPEIFTLEMRHLWSCLLYTSDAADE